MGTVAPPDSAALDRRVERGVVGRFLLVRLLGNLFIRFPYVFINQIARGLGVEITTLTFVFGVRELGGLAAPLAGRWVDRGHAGRVIAACGLVAGTACAVAAAAPFWLFVVLMVLGGASKISIDLAQNAWVGHHVDLRRRGKVIGLIETTWAGAFLLGVPLLGWGISRWGWEVAFYATGPLLALTAVVAGRRLPETPGSERSGDEEPRQAVSHVARGADLMRLRRAVWAFCVLQPGAQMLIFAVNGDWFSTELGMSTTTLGVVTALLGVAELGGTGLAIALTDRFGSLRCGMWGILLTAPPLLGIIAVGDNVVAAVALMLAMCIGVEFAFVTVLPMVPELDVERRGRAVGHVFVMMMVARAISSWTAGVIYDLGGFTMSILVASGCCVAGGAVLWWARRPSGVAAVPA